MGLSFLSGLPKSFGFASGSSVPDTFKFPVNSLIPYYGSSTDAGLNDWVRYSTADGYYLKAVTAQNQIAVKSGGNSGGINASGSTGSAGAHSGGSVTQNVTGSTGSPFISPAGSSGVSHSHSYSGSVYSSADTMLNKQNITLLRCIRSTRYLPINALVTKEAAPLYSEAFTTSTANNYLCGANDLIYTTGTGYNFNIGLYVSSDYGHYHASGSSAYRQMTLGAYYRNWDMTYGGSHSHSASAAFTQSIIDSKLLNLWKLTKELIPTGDLIIMYVGSIAQLPTTWKLCDGTNETPNLGGYIIGYKNNTWNVTTSHNALGSVSGTDSAYVPHNHLSSYSRTANVGGGYALHTNYGWSHSHSISNYSISQYVPQNIGVAFIQYKG